MCQLHLNKAENFFKKEEVGGAQQDPKKWCCNGSLTSRGPSPPAGRLVLLGGLPSAWPTGPTGPCLSLQPLHRPHSKGGYPGRALRLWPPPPTLPLTQRGERCLFLATDGSLFKFSSNMLLKITAHPAFPVTTPISHPQKSPL